MWLFIYLLTRNGSRAGLKKDLRVSRVGPGGSLNPSFFCPSELFPKDLPW
ncbi:hypothetical protein PAHAL_1G230200 [Panicum hallii]|uniref:Uncharacterized protein n=1 Tax=Panicum hallii TaxID=206008 RepID=A0A2T8KW19_9POAL|nr:hypothetical protein PAHAL_1G230200 [Panicum hallii]